MVATTSSTRLPTLWVSQPGRRLRCSNTQRMALGWRVATALSTLLLGAFASGCAPSEHPARPSAPASAAVLTALGHDAVLVGIALDSYSHGAGDGFPPERFSSSVLGDAGIDLPAGLAVQRYAYASRPSGGKFRDLANPGDYWQFCITDSDGSWVSYGETSGVQQFGVPGEDAACAFTGTTHPDARFDVRLFARSAWDAITRDPRAEDAGYQYPAALDEATLATFGLSLPPGWSVPDYDQRGYTALQYCVTAPSGEWYYVHNRTVGRYDVRGNCHLDPGMRSSG